MFDFIKKKLASEDKTSFQITVFILLALLAVTYFFRSYFLGFIFGPQLVTFDDLKDMETGGYYQNYVSLQADGFVDTGDVLVSQTTQKGRVIGEDTTGYLIAVPVHQDAYLMVNAKKSPSEGKKTYTGFLSDEMQYNIPSWQQTLPLKNAKLLPFYLDEAQKPQWWIFVLWIVAWGWSFVAMKEMIYGYPKTE